MFKPTVGNPKYQGGDLSSATALLETESWHCFVAGCWCPRCGRDRPFHCFCTPQKSSSSESKYAKSKITLNHLGYILCRLFPPPVLVICFFSSKISDWVKNGKMPQILRYHIVACSALFYDDLTPDKNVTTLHGEQLKFTISQVAKCMVSLPLLFLEERENIELSMVGGK